MILYWRVIKFGKVLVIGGLPKSLVNFRGHLIAEMQARGHNVVASAGGMICYRENLKSYGGEIYSYVFAESRP